MDRSPGWNSVRAWLIAAFVAASAAVLPSCERTSHERVPVTNGALLFPTIGDQAIELGSTLEFDVVATQTRKRPITLQAGPAPLPRNVCFNVRTGKFTFSPEPAQVTSATVPTVDVTFTATDGINTRSQLVRITVTERPAGSPTLLVGEVLAPGTRAAVVSAEVRADVSGDVTAVQANGKFAIEIDPAEPHVDIDGRMLTPAFAFVAEDISLLLGHPIYEGQVNTVLNPIYIPELGAPAGVVDPNVDSMLTNPDAGIEVVVAAGSAKNPDGTLFTGEMFLPEVPRDQTPAALPENLVPSLVIAIQPAELTFDPPATITFPNRDDLDPGSTTDIWSIDPFTGRFAIAGTGRVSDDGTIIETVTGGISASSWHFPSPAPPGDDNETDDSPNDNEEPPCGEGVGSTADAKTGNLQESIRLPSWTSLGQRRDLGFFYNSNNACPCPIIPIELTLPSGAAVPLAFESVLDVAGLEGVYNAFTDVPSGAIRHATQFDATAFDTGRYSYALRSRSHYRNSSVGSKSLGTVLVNNQISSPFGAGWELEGLQRIWIPANDPTVTLTEGDGTVMAFSPRNESSTSVLTDIAFVMDGSLSISSTEFALALSGISASLRDPAVIPHNGSVAITFIQFAADAAKKPIARTEVPLTVIDSTLTAESLADTIDAVTKLGTGPGTPIFIGVDEAVLSVGVGHPGARQVMCVTTDGATGRPNDAFKSADAAIVAGFDEIDAIAIGDGVDFDFLDDFVRNGFVVTAASFADFVETMPSKLRLVIGGSPAGDFTQMTKRNDGTYERITKEQTRYRFSTTGFLDSVVDRNGNTTSYQYDIAGRVISMTDPSNATTEFRYGLDGMIDTITDPTGRITRLDHDAAGNLVEVELPDGSTRQFEYDANHRLIRQTNELGQATSYEYDHGGRFCKATRPDGATTALVASQVSALVVDPGLTSKASPATAVAAANVAGEFTDALGQVRQMRFHRLGGREALLDSLGQSEAATFDDNGLRLTRTMPSGRNDTADYDSLGNATERIDAAGSPVTRTRRFEFASPFSFLTKQVDGDDFETVYDYDPITGDLLTITSALGKSRTFTYDARGLPLTSRDELLRVTQFSYDALGNLETVVDPLGNVTRYERDAAGNLTKIIEGLGTSDERVREFEYDALGRLVRDIDGTGAATRYTYDARGNMLTTTTPTGEVERRTYDSRDQLITLDDPIRGRTTYAYDAKGRLVSETNALGAKTTFQYDVRDRVVKKSDAVGNSETYGYDADGNLASITNGRGKTFIIGHDLLGRRVTFQTPMGRVRTWEYDLRDNLRFARVQGGPTVEHRYDELSRLLTTLPGDDTITRTYDDASQLLSVIDSDTRLGFTYDGAGRLRTAATQAGGLQPVVTLTYNYDAVSNLTSLADSIVGTHAYGYDDAGRMISITPPNGGTIGQSFDAAGRLSGISYPNGVGATYSYDSNGRLARIRHLIGTADVLDLLYGHDAIGNITAMTEPALAATFNYDLIEQLTRGVTVAGAEDFGYDAAGNRLAGGAVYNDDNQLTEDATFTYAYNARGDRISRTRKSNGVVTTYTWSNLGQLIRVSEPGGNTSEYKYDGLGRRVQKSINGVITKYVYDRDDIVGEYTASNAFKARYTHGSGIDRPLAFNTGGANYWYHADHLGSIRCVTDSSGAVVNDYEYSSYGVLDNGSVEAVDQPYGYTGREDAGEAGLWYYRARFYDAATGGFVSEDPIRPEASDLNYSRYAHGSPLNLTDPIGLDACFVDFPDYPITVPYTEWKTTLTPGHAGVLGYNGSTGETRYYEYGRYDSDFGNVRRQKVPNVEIGKDGKPTPESMKALEDYLSKNQGKNTPARLTCEKGVNEREVYDYAEKLMSDAKRAPYSWNPFSSNTCRDFARDAIDAGRSK